jgi:autotransporter-associated beta strand protein
MSRGISGSSRAVVFAIAIVAALVLAVPALAATQTMNVETSNGSWSFAGNWNLGAGPAPSNGDAVILAQGGANNTIYDLDPSVQLQSITLQNRATDPWTVFTQGGHPITLASGGSFTDSNSSTGPDSVGPMAVNGPTSITLAASAIGLKLAGGISGTGPVTYTNSSADDGLVVDHATSYTGATTVASSTHRVLFSVNGAVPTGSALDVEGAARFPQNSTVGSLKGAGTVVIEAPWALTVGGDNTDTDWSGAITAVGNLAGLDKVGTGTFTISGTGNTYGAPTAVDGGTLKLNGTIDSPVVVRASGTLAGSGATSSTVDPPEQLFVRSDGTVSPGEGLGSTGTLHVGSVEFDYGAIYAPDIDPPAPVNDSIEVTGAVSLDNAKLSPNLIAPYTHTVGSIYTIIDNDGSDPVTGTFNGLPEGADLNVGGNHFTVSYAGGDGNDVTLTAASAPPPSGGPEDPRCARFRAKLKRQHKGLVKATRPRKRAFIRHNIGQTRTRLRVFGCATS